jgi:hypothetical protein
VNAAHRLARLIEGPSAGEQVTKAGGYVDIGPECFGLADGSVICWRGENYTPMRMGLRVRLHNWLVAVGNRRIP